MQISESKLRQLISSLLIEGPEQDRQSLIAKYPASEDRLRILPVKFITWLWDRFGDNARQEEIHPFEDAIVTINNFAKADASIGAKWKSNEQFKKAVEEAIPERRWSTPTDIKTMTVDEMETIIGISQRKKQRFDVQKEDTSFESDRVGKVGPWNLWMPTTRENSCKIAQYDPASMKPKTTWCTARTDGSNLFYNYVGKKDQDVTLFYIIKDEPRDSNDWLSLGFVNGKPDLDGKDGGVSVNRDNKGLTRKSLKNALGTDFDQVINALKQKNEQLGGKHPAAKKIEEATKSVEAYEDLVRGLSTQEKFDLTYSMLTTYEEGASKDVLIKLADDKDEDIRRQIAGYKNAPTEILEKLVKDKDKYVKLAVLNNKTAPKDLLTKLATSEDHEIRSAISTNTSTPPETLIKLSNDTNMDVKAGVLTNKSCPKDLLTKLANSENEKFRYYISKNTSTPPETLAKLAEDEKEEIRKEAASNLSAPPELKIKLLEDPKTQWWTAAYIAKTLQAGHPDALLKASNSKDGNIRKGVAQNPVTPIEILAKLAIDKDEYVRAAVAQNPSTPLEILKKLAKDKHEIISRETKKIIIARGLQESLLRQIIRQLL